MFEALHPELRAAWEDGVNAPFADEYTLERLFEAFRAHAPERARKTLDDERQRDALWASVVTARTAFVVPEAGIAVWDALASLWLAGTPFQLDSRSLGAARDALAAPGRLPTALPAALWELVRDGVDATTITPRIAALGAAYPVEHRERLARAVRMHAGSTRFLDQGDPVPRITLESLADCEDGTLGHAFYRLIVDNDFDLEVLDPDTVSDYHPDLDLVNRNILRTHEVWHLVGGYSTSPLHEVAISGFQLGQFGHPYSRDFLAVVIMLGALVAPELIGPLLQVSTEGWRHGRATPPLLLVPWHERWNTPISDLRETIPVAPYRSVIPDMPAANTAVHS